MSESVSYAETALLTAVRDSLQAANTWDATICQVEIDEMAPATIGQLYIVVMPKSPRPGPRHNSSGGVSDLIYGLEIGVIKRVGNVPRDRLRDAAFLDLLNSLNAVIDLIYPVINFNYDVINLASSYIETQTGSNEVFIEPLKLTGMDEKPRDVPAEVFAGTKGEKAGIAKKLRFDGARRITTIS